MWTRVMRNGEGDMFHQGMGKTSLEGRRLKKEHLGHARRQGQGEESVLGNGNSEGPEAGSSWLVWGQPGGSMARAEGARQWRLIHQDGGGDLRDL